MTLCSDAMLLTRGRAGTERMIAAALLLEGVLGGQLDVVRGRVVAGRRRAEFPLMAELRARVMTSPPDSPGGWIEHAAGFVPARAAADLVSRGLADPLAHRRLSVDARAEAAARERAATGPLALLLSPFPPPAPSLPPAAREIAQAMRSSAIASKTWTYASTDASSWVTESVHSSSRPGVMKMPRFMLYSQASSLRSWSWLALNVS